MNQDAPASEQAAKPYPGRWRSWMAALRPASLPMAVGPVLVGAAAAYAQSGVFHTGLAALALAAALLMQAITNLQNDVGYTVRDGERLGDRVGLPRATAEGWLQAAVVRHAIVALSLVGLGLGLWLVASRGWPVLVMGFTSLLAALAYMGGPRPIAYTPFGELTVFVFFGLVAVPGTEWLLTGDTSAGGWLGAVSVGALAAATLAVNNLRDAAHDRLAGRRTLAVVAGSSMGVRFAGALLVTPLLASVFAAASLRQPWLLLPWVLAPQLFSLWRSLHREQSGADQTRLVLALFRLNFVLALVLVFALLLAGGAGGAGGQASI